MATAPVTNEDRLPHDWAVWRDHDGGSLPPPGTAGLQVAIDFGDGQITQSWGHFCQWRGVKRWRFGWAPA